MILEYSILAICYMGVLVPVNPGYCYYTSENDAGRITVITGAYLLEQFTKYKRQMVIWAYFESMNWVT